MKGLLIKDILSMRKQLKVVALLIAFYIVYSLTMQDVSMLGSIIMLLAVMMPITAMAYDEKSHWGHYEAALPISKQVIVFSKYVFGFILIALGCVVSSVCIVLLSILSDFAPLSEGLFTVAAFAVIGLVFMSLILPILFRFGVEKGRMLMLLVIFTPVMLIMLLSRMPVSMPDADTLTSWIPVVPILVPLLVAGSIYLSIWVYQRKEF